MAPRKVLFLINTLRTGGSERNLVSICQHIDRQRFQPEVWQLVAGGEFEEKVRQAGVPVRNLNRRSPRSVAFAVRAAWQIAHCEAHLIHVFLPTIGFYAALARTLFRMQQPVVLWAGTPATRRWDWLMFRWFARCFNRVIANSRSVKQVTERLGFAPAQISVIPNGHDLTRFSDPFDRERLRQQLGVTPDEKLLLFVGRLIGSKRVCDAIDAVAMLLAKGARLKFIIVGDGPERERLEAHVNRIGIDANVVFAGHRADIHELMRSADLFVFPSESEGLPNSIIEACLASLPIIACLVPGVTDLLTNGKHALLVPPQSPIALAQAIERTLAEAEESLRRVVAAREMATANFSIDRFMKELYAVYDRVLAEQKPA